MKYLIGAFLLLPIVSLAQPDDNEINKRLRKLTRAVLKVPEKYTQSPYHLSNYIDGIAETDLEKTWSFYVWIANNITYDMVGFKADQLPEFHPRAVLHNRYAVCDGYARLFRQLCLESGIHCEIIKGYSKGYGYEAGQTFEVSNHAWNAVFIDNSWHLIDVTWAARQNNADDRVRSLDEQYFLTPPQEFIYDHLPEIPAWQLLSAPVSKASFEASEIEVIAGNYNYRDTLSELLESSGVNRTITYQLMAREFDPNNDKANYKLGLEYRYKGLDTLEAIYKVEYPDTVIFNQLERSAFASFDEAALYFTLIKPGNYYYESAQVFLDDTDFERGVFKYEVAHRIIELYNQYTPQQKENSREFIEQLILKYYQQAAIYFEGIPGYSWYYEKAQEYLKDYLKNPFGPD